MTRRIYLYDSMLRDGAQSRDVDLSVVDKQEIALLLDSIGVDYIEGGFLGANPTDDTFFSNPPTLSRSKIVAFGMTRRPSMRTEEDKGLAAIINSGVKHACLVGKAWDFHVTDALGIPLAQNLEMIEQSVAHLAAHDIEVMLDAEHFFDGYKHNAQYAIEVVKAAERGGASFIVLCDTNGGTLPHEVYDIVSRLTQHIDGEKLGIHCHNDTDNAVANSLEAVRAGACQVQGVVNGWGERCGNANLISLIPTLLFKMGYDIGVTAEDAVRLTSVSRKIDERLGALEYGYAAYVGRSAFAHKGGIHASAVLKDSRAYEHIEPSKIGNERIIVISDQAGRSNIIARMQAMGIGNAGDEEMADTVSRIVAKVKRREKEGYTYSMADASFELLALAELGRLEEIYVLRSFRVIDERRWSAVGTLITLSEATVRLEAGGQEHMEIAEGTGPVDALNNALVKALTPHYPAIARLKLVDYKVRIFESEKGTGAKTRVIIESMDSDTGRKWKTIGVSSNIIDASYEALADSLSYLFMVW